MAAPHTRAGRKVVDQALAALIVEVETGRSNELKIRPKLGKMRVSKVRAMHLDALYAELRKELAGQVGVAARAAHVVIAVLPVSVRRDRV